MGGTLVSYLGKWEYDGDIVELAGASISIYILTSTPIYFVT